MVNDRLDFILFLNLLLLLLIYYIGYNSRLYCFSLLLPSCMVVPIRELVNILFSSTIKHLLFILIVQNSSNIDININLDIFRGRSVFSSNNSLKESSMHSNASFVPYYKRMEIQSDNLL